MGYNSNHVHYRRPQPRLSPPYPAARELSGARRPGQDSHPRQSLQVARRSDRRVAPQSSEGETLLAPEEAFENIASFHHGHVSAVLTAMRRLGLPQLLASRPSRPRQLVLAMVAARLLEPASKLATTRWWQVTTLPAELGVEEADEEDLYAALDWLVQRQAPIEKKLAARHLRNDGLALYDLTIQLLRGHHLFPGQPRSTIGTESAASSRSTTGC